MRSFRAWIFLVGFTVLSVCLVLALRYERAQAADDRDQQLHLDVSSESARVDEYFERARSIVLLLSQNPAFREFYEAPGTREEKVLASIASVGEANAALGFLGTLYPDSIGEACFIDETGPEIARVVREEIAEFDDLSLDESEATFFHPTFALDHGEVFQAMPYVSPDTGEWVIANSTLVPFESGAKRAIVHYEVTVKSFGLPANNLDSRTRIVDADGRVVVDSAYPQVVGEPLGRPEQTQFAGTFPADGRSSGMITIGGERLAYQRVGAAPNNANVWYLVASSPASISFVEGVGPFSVGILVASLALLMLAIAASNYQRRLRHQATTDELTGLPNRNLFESRADQALAQAARNQRAVAILLIDLDHFKDVNDTLGHHRGDELLLEIGDRLGRVVRGSDSVSRLGGDEFAVLLTETSGTAGAAEFAERITAEAFSQQMELAGVPVHVGASIGIAVYPEHGTDVESLLQHADVAMYHAKRNGLPYGVYSDGVDPNSPERLAIVAELRTGIANGELILHYQPKFELATSTLVGMEALVRWNHPRRGLLSPAEFLGVAETSGLIPPLTRFVLREAADQLVRWCQDRPDFTVAVNISRRSLTDPTFLDDVVAVLGDTGIDPGGLILEISENSLFDNIDRAVEVLAALQDLGVRISLDDFGTGFSSMASLRELPVEELKIDQSFIRNLAHDTADQAIVRATIALGHSLNCIVTAEGIEDDGALHQLLDMHCDLAQGFRLGRPAPPEELAALFDRQPAPVLNERTNGTLGR